MTSDWSADLDSLAGTAACLDQLLGDVRGHTLDGIDCRPEMFGHPGLAAAASDLGDRWRRGIAYLTTDAVELADGLTQTVATYRHAEDLAHRALRTAGAALPEPVHPGPGVP